MFTLPAWLTVKVNDADLYVALVIIIVCSTANLIGYI